MSRARGVEGIFGALATLAGVAAVVVLIFGPGYNSEGCTIQSAGQPPVCVTTTIRTLIEVNGFAAIFDLTLVTILVVGVGVWAVWHARTSRPRLRIGLWIYTVILLVFVLLSGFSIGPTLLPSAALALVAALASLGNRPAVAP
jgi:cytochrome bd-type quinol oxidase subunit 2